MAKQREEIKEIQQNHGIKEILWNKGDMDISFDLSVILLFTDSYGLHNNHVYNASNIFTTILHSTRLFNDS